jgi:hypothetical protein
VWWYPPEVLGRERGKGWQVAQMALVASSRVSKINILNKENFNFLH